MEIKLGVVTSICLANGKETTRVSSRVNCPEGIQAGRLCQGTVIENLKAPRYVGHVSKSAYKLEGGKLTVVGYPDPGSGPDKVPTRVDSVFVRE